MSKEFKSGFVAIIGRPNVGKSTLINILVKQKIAVVSKKPQTTRHKFRCIVNLSNAQIIFIDTPGFHKPHDLLGKHLNKTVRQTLREVDVIIFLADAYRGIGKGDDYIASELKKLDTPVIIALNKIDRLNADQLKAQLEMAKQLGKFKKTIAISSLLGKNTNQLLEEIIALLPPGPKYYPDEMITDQPERIVFAEFIREKVLELTREEIPHSIAVQVEDIRPRETQDLIDVTATIYVERESQKGIIIGKGGKLLKEIGSRARLDLERLLGNRVFLQLWVKIKKDWRRKEKELKELGF